MASISTISWIDGYELSWYLLDSFSFYSKLIPTYGKEEEEPINKPWLFLPVSKLSALSELG